MNSSVESKALRFPAYSLYHVSTLEESARGHFLYDIVPTFQARFTGQEQQQIIQALEWAADAPAVDWELILPGLPHTAEFRREHLRLTLGRLRALDATG